MRVGPRKFANLVLGWCLTQIPPDKREEWMYQLEAPLPGSEGRVNQTELQRDAEAFMSAQKIQAIESQV
jgi:hypothetical protein